MADLSEHVEHEMEETVDAEFEEGHPVADDGSGDEAEGEEYEEGVDEAYSEEEEDGEIADDEEDQPAAGGGGSGGGGQQMVYIPGLGMIPLSSLGGLGNLGGLLGGSGGGGRAAQPAQPDPEGLREWTSLSSFPAATQDGLLNALHALQEDGRSQLTVLLLGKGGVGKSSTINSLLNERAANVAAFQTDATRTVCFSREASNFTLNLIDTPSVLDQDSVSEARLEQIGKAIANRHVDAVLFLDRLDSYALGPLDKQVMEGISRVLGTGIWRNTLIAFTRASESSTPPGVEFNEYVEQRAQQMRKAIRAAGAPGDADLPVALIENSSRCATNEDGEKVVPGELPWIVDVVEKIAEVALNAEPFVYDQRAASRASDPNRRRKWLIPLVLAAQVAIKLLLDRVMDDDSCRGDSNGPFDAQTVRERREELRQERERRAKKAKAKKAAATAVFDDVDELEVADFDDDEDDY